MIRILVLKLFKHMVFVYLMDLEHYFEDLNIYLVIIVCGRRWYPPGHGDIYTALKRCGLLEKFMEEGKEILFISNIDNLGATVDTS